MISSFLSKSHGSLWHWLGCFASLRSRPCCRWMPWRMLWKSALAEFSPTAAISWGKHPSNDQKVISKRVLSLQGVFWALALVGKKKHTAYSQYNTMIYSIWASTFLMTRNRVQKSCLKLPGVALVDFVGGDHFMCLNWTGSAPYVERQECEMKEANSELLSKRDEVSKNWANWSGWWGLWVRNGKKGIWKNYHNNKKLGITGTTRVSFFGGLAFECPEFCWLSQLVFDEQKNFHRISWLWSCTTKPCTVYCLSRCR